MIDTDDDVSEKYEGLIDAEGYIDYDGLDHLLAEVKRLRKELDMRIALIAEVDTMIGEKWNVTQDDWNELVYKHYVVEMEE